MHRLTSLAVFLLCVVIAAATAGRFVGGDWYHQVMNQPGWNPPAMVMAPVWAVLYVLMAVSAWMVWDTKRGLARNALALWGLQLLLGITWSWMFFGMHRVGWALAVLSLWLFGVIVVIKTFKSIKPEAASLMLPVAVWLLFSWLLNFVQWRLNGGGIASVL
jgi:tryptophan-rich sensory protein